MDRRKIAPLLLNEEEEEIKQPFVKMNIVKPKKNLPIKKLFFIALLIGGGVYYFNNQQDINKNTSSLLGDSTMSNIEMPTENKTDNPKVEASQMAVDMKRAMEEKKTENVNKEETLSSPVQAKSNNSDNDFPAVNIGATKTEQSSPSSSVQQDGNSNQSASNKVMLQKELNMLLKNSTFSINTKKDSISLFISNMNYNIGEPILNNNKFKLSSIKMNCEDGKMPSFTFDIQDSSSSEVLFTKDIKYSDNKKIVLAFDSLSITDLGSNTENIYLPDETIFKNFTLNNIMDKNSMLSFEFICENKKITIDGKELSTIE